jgi:hypothetical protein
MDEQNEDHFQNATQLITKICGLIDEANLPIPAINWVLCQLTSGALATSNNYEESKKLFLQHISDISQLYRDNPEQNFFERVPEVLQ